MSDKVSVIVTAYNQPQWLNQCIDSVLNQTYENLELIVMEDNSSDLRVREILESYDDPRMQVHFSRISETERYKRARYATLINEAVRKYSTGQYLSYLGDDDFYYLDRIERLVGFAKENGYDIVYGTQDVGGGDPPVITGQRGPFGVLDNGFDLLDHNSVLHTRAVFDLAGGWDDDFECWGGADGHFWRRIAYTRRFKFYPLGGEPTEFKRYHNDSVQHRIGVGTFFPWDLQNV